MTSRLPWVDAVRFLAVFLVVWYHMVLWFEPALATQGSATAESSAYLQLSLARIRIPLLMAVSGFLAAPSIARGWEGGVRRRFLSNYWLYLVWIVGFYVFYRIIWEFVDDPNLPQPIRTLGQLATNIVAPSTVLWFLLCMAVFPVIVWVLQLSKIPVWVVLTLGVAIWCVGTYSGMPDTFGKPARALIFYMMGVYAGPAVAKLRTLNLASGVSLLVAAVLFLYNVPRIGGLSPALGGFVTASVALVAIAALFPHIIRTGRPWQWLGSRTLDIYVLHMPVLSTLYLLLRQQAWVAEVLANAALAGLFVLTLTLLAVAGCLLIGAALRLVPGLMTPPKWLIRAREAGVART